MFIFIILLVIYRCCVLKNTLLYGIFQSNLLCFQSYHRGWRSLLDPTINIEQLKTILLLFSMLENDVFRIRFWYKLLKDDFEMNLKKPHSNIQKNFNPFLFKYQTYDSNKNCDEQPIFHFIFTIISKSKWGFYIKTNSYISWKRHR